MAMQNPGTIAPVVIGGKLRAIMLYLDQTQMQARNLSPLDVMDAVEKFNIFFPSGNVKIGDKDIALSSNSMYHRPRTHGRHSDQSRAGQVRLSQRSRRRRGLVLHPDQRGAIVDGHNGRSISLSFARSAPARLAVVDTLRKRSPEIKAKLSERDIDLKVVMDQSVYVRGLDQGPGAGRAHRRGPVLAGHPACSWGSGA